MPKRTNNNDENKNGSTTDLGEKIRVDGEIKQRENKYYLRLSDRYRTAGFLLFLVFVVFCGVMMLRYSEYITYDNFVYLVRDFDSVNNSGSAAKDEVLLDIDGDSTVERFREGFAVVSSDTVTLYDSTGVELVSEKESFSYPAVAAGEKYLIAYDVGGSSYSIYNSVTRVVAKKTEFPIICASVSDTGAYIVTTESDEAKYVTEVYNAALTRTMSIYKDKYVIASAMSDDGDYIAIASLSESGADFACDVSFYKVGQAEAVKTQTFIMAMPMILESMEDGKFVLLCDDAVRFFTSEGELISSTSVSGNGASHFDVQPWGAVLVCRENAIGSANRVYAFNSDGAIEYSEVVSDRVTGVRVPAADSGYTAYLTVPGGALLINENAERELYPSESEIICTVDMSSGPYICVYGKALRLTRESE